MKRSCLLLCAFAAALLLSSTDLAAEDLKIEKDKQGTTWTVGSDESREKARREEEREKDRAWDMLRNQSIIIDKRPVEKQKK